MGERQTSKINFAYFARTLVNGCSLFLRNLYPQVKSMVTFEDGKIVTVQTAIKEGQKSTRWGMDLKESNNNENRAGAVFLM